MTRKTIQSLTILLPMLLGAVLIGHVTVNASSAGPDTIVLSPANVAPGPGVKTSFTQDVVISYSHNAANATPKVSTMQYVIVYDSAVIDVDQTACATSTDFNTYCGVTPGTYAQKFPVQQVPTNNPCGANFCAVTVALGGTMKQIFVASIASLTASVGLVSAGGTHATFHWKVVSGNGKTGINFSGADTFYSTSTTSAIDPGKQIFYVATNGSFDNSLPPVPTGADFRLFFTVSPSLVLFTNTSITVNSFITNLGSQPGNGTYTLTYGLTTIRSQGIAIAAGTQLIFTDNFNVGTSTGTFALKGTAGNSTFIDPTPSDNTFIVKVAVRNPPSFVTLLNFAKPDTHKLSLSVSHTVTFTASINFTATSFVFIQYTMMKESGPLPTITTGIFKIPNFVACPGHSGTLCTISISLDMSLPIYGIGKYSVEAQLFYSDKNIGPFLTGGDPVDFSYRVIA